jgi:hypothetical protein
MRDVDALPAVIGPQCPRCGNERARLVLFGPTLTQATALIRGTVGSLLRGDYPSRYAAMAGFTLTCPLQDGGCLYQVAGRVNRDGDGTRLVPVGRDARQPHGCGTVVITARYVDVGCVLLDAQPVAGRPTAGEAVLRGDEDHQPFAVFGVVTPADYVFYGLRPGTARYRRHDCPH